MNFQEWHVGYLDKALAKKLHKNKLAKDVELIAELHHLAVEGDRVSIELAVLEPEEPEPTKQ